MRVVIGSDWDPVDQLGIPIPSNSPFEHRQVFVRGPLRRAIAAVGLRGVHVDASRWHFRNRRKPLRRRHATHLLMVSNCSQNFAVRELTFSQICCLEKSKFSLYGKQSFGAEQKF